MILKWATQHGVALPWFIFRVLPSLKLISSSSAQADLLSAATKECLAHQLRLVCACGAHHKPLGYVCICMCMLAYAGGSAHQQIMHNAPWAHNALRRGARTIDALGPVGQKIWTWFYQLEKKSSFHLLYFFCYIGILFTWRKNKNHCKIVEFSISIFTFLRFSQHI